MLSDEDIRGLLGPASEQTVQAPLQNVAFAVVSPDGLALVTLTKIDVPASDAATLEAVALALQESNASTVAGMTAVRVDPITLDGVEAIRLTYTADDPATGAPGGRLIRQIVTTADAAAIVLTLIVGAQDAPAFDGTFRLIEESWQWQP